MGSYENPAIITDKSSEILAQGLTNVGEIFSRYATTVVEKKKIEAEETRQFNKQVDAVKAWEYSVAGQTFEGLGSGNEALVEKYKPFIAEDLAAIGRAKVRLLKANSREEKDFLLKEISNLEQIYSKNVKGIEGQLINAQAAAENADASYLDGINGTDTQMFTYFSIINGQQPGEVKISRGEKGSWVASALPSADGPSKDIAPISMDTFWLGDPKNVLVTKKSNFSESMAKEVFKTTKVDTNNFADEYMSTTRDIVGEDGKVINKISGIEKRKILDVNIYTKPTEDTARAGIAAAFASGTPLADMQSVYKDIAREGDPLSYNAFLKENALLSQKEKTDKLFNMALIAVKQQENSILSTVYGVDTRDGSQVFFSAGEFVQQKQSSTSNPKTPSRLETKKQEGRKELKKLKEGDQFNFAQGNFNKYVKKVGKEYKVYDTSGDLDVLTFKNETDALNFMYGL